MLPQYKPQLCTFLTHTCTNMAETIKAEPTACTTPQQSYLFVLRHGGSGEPALPPTEVLDRCRKRRGSAAQVIRSVQKLISVRKDRSSYGSSRASTRFFYGSNQGGKGVRNQAEDFGHSGTKHLRISGSTVLRLLDVGLSKLCPKTNS